MKVTFDFESQSFPIDLTPTGKSYRATVGDKTVDVEIIRGGVVEWFAPHDQVPSIQLVPILIPVDPREREGLRQEVTRADEKPSVGYVFQPRLPRWIGPLER